MTEPATHLDDEQLSDLLDGIASEAEVEHVAACAPCATRLAVWREVADAVSTAPAAPTERRQGAIEAALSRLDDQAGSTTASPVIDLKARRAHRGAAVAVRVAAAAAVLAVVGGVSAVAIRGGGTASHRANSAAPATAHPAGTGGASQTGSRYAPSAGSPSAPVPVLGNIDTTTELVSALNTPTAAPTAGVSSGAAASSNVGASSQGPQSCAPPVRPGENITEKATLVWKGTPATAYVYASGQAHTALVEADGSCKLLVTVSY